MGDYRIYVLIYCYSLVNYFAKIRSKFSKLPGRLHRISLICRFFFRAPLLVCYLVTLNSYVLNIVTIVKKVCYSDYITVVTS